MFSKWISKVVNTIPFIGNVTPMEYTSSGKCNKVVTAFCLPMRVDTNPPFAIVLNKSELDKYTGRVNKYSKVVNLAKKEGCFSKNSVIQLSTGNNKKMTFRVFSVGYVYINGETKQLFMSDTNIESAVKRFEQIKDKLNFELTLKQRIALLLAKLQGLSFEVFKI